jgi:hypothetical protein
MEGYEGRCSVNARELLVNYPNVFAKKHEAYCASLNDYEWYDSIFDDFKEGGKAKGFVLEHINFSGFASQGDGACWAGDVDVAAFIKANYDLTEPKYHVLLALVEEGVATRHVSIYTSGRYCHENTMHIREGVDYFDDIDDNQCMKSGLYMGANISELFKAIGGLSLTNAIDDDILKAARSYAVELYRALEEEYDHLTTEESFIEHCEWNEVDFEVEVENQTV